MKKFRERKREQNVKIQYLTFIQNKVFDFLASRNNGYIKDYPGAAGTKGELKNRE